MTFMMSSQGRKTAMLLVASLLLNLAVSSTAAVASADTITASAVRRLPVATVVGQGNPLDPPSPDQPYSPAGGESGSATSAPLIPEALLPDFTNRSTRVMVHIPNELHHPLGEDHLVAAFQSAGTITSTVQQQGESVASFVYLYDTPLCDPIQFIQNNTNLYPKPDTTATDELLLQPPFLLLALGGGACSVSVKARHAADAGAAGLVLADPSCRCSDTECIKQFGPNCRDDTEGADDLPPWMIVSGSRPMLPLPTFMLYKVLATNLTDQLKKNQPVLLELTWGLPVVNTKPNTTAADGEVTTTATYNGQLVDVQLWSTAHDDVLDLSAYRHMRDILWKMVPAHASFKPRFQVLDGSRFHCNHQVTTGGPCDQLCTNHGRYCALHAKDLSGRAVIHEVLRRMCIWKEYGHEEDYNAHTDAATETLAEYQQKQLLGLHQYWDYVVYHVEHCSLPHLYANETCVKEALAHAQIDFQKIDTCVNSDTGGIDADSINALLESAVKLQAQSGVVQLPAIALTVKNDQLDKKQILLQQHSAEALFDGICNSFWQQTYTTEPIPEICAVCASCVNKVGCVTSGHCVGFSSKRDNEIEPASGSGGGSGVDPNHGTSAAPKRGHGWRFFTFLLFVGMMGGAYYYYQNHREDFEQRRTGMLNGYLHLTGEGEG